jgi:hypothetical protein
MPFIISKAWREAKSVAKAANIITPDTLGDVLAKAEAEASAVGKFVKPAEAQPAGEKKETAEGGTGS